LKLFEGLGDQWDWHSADTLLHRAKLQARTGQADLAVLDLTSARTIFQRLKNTVGVAKCFLEGGELFDSIGRRIEAAKLYQQAAAIAATWKNDSKASYFYFRHACKLAELREYEDAERIFIFLANADWLEQQLKLTVISQLCLIAHATKKDKELKERCSLALSIIDDLIQKATSAEERRSLLIKKGQHLEQVGQHDEALQCFKNAIERFEAVGDQEGIIESWFHISGLMGKLGDRKKEREASEKVLALGAEKTSRIHAALTLVMLAQQNIGEQRFSEAKQQLDRAEELDPENPAVGMIAADLRSKLPQLSSHNLGDVKQLNHPPERDLPSLIQELHEWCKCYPQMREAILPLWYYIRRSDLWGIFRSMLGVKFLICAVDGAKFDRLRNGLHAHGDLYAWGTNVGLKTKAKVELIPVPWDLPVPAGTTLLLNESSTSIEGETNAWKSKASEEAGPLKRLNGLPDKRYYAVAMKDVDGFPDGSPFFGGRTFRLDRKIEQFMLDRSAEDLVANSLVCLPLTERDLAPNLKYTMQVAWENGAIPVFSERLPHSDEINAVCDSILELPTGAAISLAAAKELWAKLLASCSEAPKFSLTNFNKEMAALLHTEPKDRLPARVYLLHFQAGSQEVVHPAIVIMSRKEMVLSND
jgi:tetratricopeptide (TPR) repeat protein